MYMYILGFFVESPGPLCHQARESTLCRLVAQGAWAFNKNP